ncbi:ESX-1 secretion-associated protein EspI-like [Pteropus medius]|uniref:ESX-1 secretion-associated protein EspI-like n=1 Tax=Pteropus vampyrus TaxID=132908 RepID=UPI00196A6C66|nr:ESX-1 secretion-associated protein EspI-like [Pteropus giganteus]
MIHEYVLPPQRDKASSGLKAAPVPPERLKGRYQNPTLKGTAPLHGAAGKSVSKYLLTSKTLDLRSWRAVGVPTTGSCAVPPCFPLPTLPGFGLPSFCPLPLPPPARNASPCPIRNYSQERRTRADSAGDAAWESPELRRWRSAGPEGPRESLPPRPQVEKPAPSVRAGRYRPASAEAGPPTDPFGPEDHAAFHPSNPGVRPVHGLLCFREQSLRNRFLPPFPPSESMSRSRELSQQGALRGREERIAPRPRPACRARGLPRGRGGDGWERKARHPTTPTPPPPGLRAWGRRCPSATAPLTGAGMSFSARPGRGSGRRRAGVCPLAVRFASFPPTEWLKGAQQAARSCGGSSGMW